jgi:23S rRNA (cytidine2498-2'-O)-methyltransferase
VNPCLEALEHLMSELGVNAVADCWVEYPDTNAGKEASRSAKAIEPRLVDALAERRRVSEQSDVRAHIFLLPDKTAYVGLTSLHVAGHDHCGIPRLRMPFEAPSRSTLKLAEAFQFFLGEDVEQLLTPEMRAVDLGAAPGGWTWQLVHRGLHVTAIDNGALKGELVDNALVRHLREDGFRYAPKVSVDWMVCDMVEQPSRIAKLVGAWLANGWCRYTIFNLKLPMKKRHEELERCREIIADAVAGTGKPLLFRAKQLYHDREEVTVFATLPSRRARESMRAMMFEVIEPSRERRRTESDEDGVAQDKTSGTGGSHRTDRTKALADVFRKAATGGLKKSSTAKVTRDPKSKTKSKVVSKTKSASGPKPRPRSGKR